MEASGGFCWWIRMAIITSSVSSERVTYFSVFCQRRPAMAVTAAPRASGDKVTSTPRG